MRICDKKLVCGKCSLCVTDVPSLCSIDQVDYEIQQRCVVRMLSGGLSLPGGKHFRVSDPSHQVNAQSSQPFWGCIMGWVMGSASAAPPHPLRV